MNHIYIIIPVYNRKLLTRDCLASLYKQDIGHYTVIVVDDGSTDGTSEMIQKEFPETILLRGDGELWWVGSINLGIRHALSLCKPDDYLLVINDDLTVKPNYLRSLIDAAQQRPRSIIGSVETTAAAPDIIKSGGVVVNWSLARRTVLNQQRSLHEFPPGHLERVSRLTGRGTLFPSGVFREAGLYDEAHFRQCGDTELPVRASFKYSYELYISYDAIVISHVHRGNNINDRTTYTLADLREYFFGMRSHFNLKDRYWFARNVAPNQFWFLRYLSLNVLWITGRYLSRLRPTR